MASNGFVAPEPKPDKRCRLFKYPHRRKWSANVVLPDGFRKILSEEEVGNTTDINVARVKAMHIVTALQKERGIESASAQKRREDQADPATPIDYGIDMDAAHRPRRGRPPGSKSASAAPSLSPLTGPPAWLQPILRRYVQNFRRIEEMIIMGLDTDPEQFRAEVRALVLDGLRTRGKRLMEPED